MFAARLTSTIVAVSRIRRPGPDSPTVLDTDRIVVGASQVRFMTISFIHGSAFDAASPAVTACTQPGGRGTEAG